MGNTKEKQLIVLIAMLIITCFLVYSPGTTISASKPKSLREYFGPINGYDLVQSIELADEIYTFLDLDDYTQTVYKLGNDYITLYVGYYLTLDKLSAAHSPLVCFPGQGWQLDTPIESEFTVGNHTIKYAEMEATLEDRDVLVLYWYQAYDRSTTKIYHNKILAVLNRLTGKSEEHAFIRVSIPIGEKGRDWSKRVAERFVSSFYPHFFSYVESKSERSQNS